MSQVLAALGWDAVFANAYAPYRATDCRPGRVARIDRGVATVLTTDGVVRASLAGGMLSAAAADPVALPCAGDWVAVRTWPDRRLTVETVLPRRTAVLRTGAGKDSHGQVLAANLNAVAVVEPLDPEPDPGRLERLLALAWESGAEPLVVLTKADVVPDPYAVAEQVATSAPGVPVHTVSGKQGSGLAPLRPLIAPGRTLGLIGASGAGKSTLVNALAGTTVMVTQRLRADGRGRHTTTYRALVPVPGGGAVLDTPRLRSVGLFDGAAGLDLAFADIDVLAEGCRFSDCEHDQEPNCAVRAAIDAGELPLRRLDSWRKLQRELAWQARRQQARLAVNARTRQRKSARQGRLPQTGG